MSAALELRDHLSDYGRFTIPTPTSIVKSEMATEVLIQIAQYASRDGRIVTVVHCPINKTVARHAAGIGKNSTDWDYNTGKTSARIFKNYAHYAVKQWNISIPAVVFPDGSIAWDPQDALDYIAAQFKNVSDRSIAARAVIA